MSRRTSSPPPAAPLSPTLLTLQFPKWNGTSNRNTPKLESAITHRKQSPGKILIATFRAPLRRFAFRSARPSPPACTERSRRGTRHCSKRAAQKLENCLTRVFSVIFKFLIDNSHRYLNRGFSSHSPLAASHCRSNRHSYEKLEPLVSHRKHSLGLFSNRHKTALHPRRGVCVPSALRNEASGARDLLVDVPVRQHHHSNRKAYVKLEIVLSSIKRATSIFLIARNTHFAQGEPAQFPCSSARSRTPRFGLAKLAAKPNLRCNFAGGKGVS